MTPAYVSSGMANHLWQSTVVAALAGLLALALRRNHARTRYWLWMIASVKFLIPFSLLVILGGYLRTALESAPLSKPDVSAVLEQVTQPFSQTSFSADVSPGLVAPPIVAQNGNKLPVLLFSLWACGCLLVAFSWWRRWRTIYAAVRKAAPIAPIADVPVLSSPTLLEPGVFGILQPVLLLPQGIIDRLTRPQLDAIVTHELCHIRRRDNLTAAMHMVVEAVFWFHPMTWWIGRRLVEERERACDEAVLQSGNEAQVYAEGILNVCKLYVESPLACVSGVTGSDLKKRIVRIVTAQVVQKLDFSRKLLLSVAGLVALAAPVTFGLLQVTPGRAQAPAENTAAQNTGNDIAGTWQGTLQVGRDLRTVLKITKADGGSWKVVLYSIDQGGQGIAASTVVFQPPTFKFSIIGIDGSYEGKLSADGSSMTGTFTQGGRALPLNLKRATPQSAWVIPEPPPRLPPMAADVNPVFEVATIKPSKPDTPGKMFRVNGRTFSTLNTSLSDIITFAYGMHPRQIVGAPAWVESDKYDLEAHPEGEGAPSDKQWKEMVQKLLAERFKLAFHHEQKELSVYALAVGKNGPKLTKSEGDPNGLPGLFFTGPGRLSARNATMGDFAQVMQGTVLDRPVIDQTELKGRFDFPLTWTPDETQFASFGGRIQPPADPANAPPGLFTAIQEQLGLKLEAKKAPADVLAIDHVEKPSAN